MKIYNNYVTLPNLGPDLSKAWIRVSQLEAGLKPALENLGYEFAIRVMAHSGLTPVGEPPSGFKEGEAILSFECPHREAKKLLKTKVSMTDLNKTTDEEIDAFVNRLFQRAKEIINE